MPEATLYQSARHRIDDEMLQDIEDMCWRKGFQFIKKEVKVSGDSFIPYLSVKAFKIVYPFTNSELERILDFVLSDSNCNETIDSRTRRPSNKTSWIYRNYVWLISVFFMLFIGIPFLAPLLMHYGKERMAGGIYKVFSVLCHQLAFRSYYLFGQQTQYPRQMAQIPGLLTYEQATGREVSDLEFARHFEGTPELGYKVAICERDIAIYGSMAFFGFIFQIARRKIKAIPWYIWVIVGLIPIAIDGGSQLPGLASGWPAWLPQRESTFVLRTITGTLFGIFTAWFLFPHMEETLKVSQALGRD